MYGERRGGDEAPKSKAVIRNVFDEGQLPTCTSEAIRARTWSAAGCYRSVCGIYDVGDGYRGGRRCKRGAENSGRSQQAQFHVVPSYVLVSRTPLVSGHKHPEKRERRGGSPGDYAGSMSLARSMLGNCNAP